jgi:hypothetical protein
MESASMHYQTVLINDGFLAVRQIFDDIPTGHLVFITTKYPMAKSQLC